MINSKSLRNQYKQIRNQTSRDVVIGGFVLAVLGGVTVALAVRGVCLLIVAIARSIN